MTYTMFSRVCGETHKTIITSGIEQYACQDGYFILHRQGKSFSDYYFPRSGEYIWFEEEET